MSRMITGGIPFSTAPGTAYEYSNFGFAILGRIVANVSGLRYPEYVRDHVLRPLGMNATTLEAASVPAARLAHGYRDHGSADAGDHGCLAREVTPSLVGSWCPGPDLNRDGLSASGF